MNAIIHALAAARLVRAYQHEQIGEPARAMVDRVTQPVVRNGVVNIAASRRREWLADLFACAHCLGFWTALAMVLADRHPLTRPVVRALAASALVTAIVHHYPQFADLPDDPVVGD